MAPLQQATKKPRTKFNLLFAQISKLRNDDKADNENVRKAIVAYAISSPKATIAALSEVTGTSQLQGQRWRLVMPLYLSAQLLHEHRAMLFREAEELFFDTNTIFVPCFRLIEEALTSRFLKEVKRLHINYRPDLTLKYTKSAVTEVHENISEALKAVPQLEYLCVAVEYEDLEAKMKAAKQKKKADGLKIIIEALGRLRISQKWLIICEDSMHVERWEDIEHVTEDRPVLETLLARDAGTAVRV